MGNSFRSTRASIPGAVTPYSLTAAPAIASTNTSNFDWGYSGSKQLLLNLLGSRVQNVATKEQFIESFNRHIKSGDIENLRGLFDLVEFTLSPTTEAMHFYTAIHCGFSEVFVHELARSKHLFGESSEVSVGPFMERHCKGSLIIHCFIIKNLENLDLVDEVLNAIASSHAFLSKLSLAIKKHDELLFKFLKIEFYEYRSKATFLSLRKYFKIVSARTQFLIEKKVELKSMTDMNEGMEYLKNIQNKYPVSNTSGSVRELFRSDSEASCPQSIMLPFRSRTFSLPSRGSSSSAFSLI